MAPESEVEIRDRDVSVSLSISGLAADFWNPVPPGSILGRSSAASFDFWQPVTAVPAHKPAAAIPAATSARAADFWSLSELPEAPTRSPSDWAEGLSLPWFDRDLRDNPYLLTLEPPSSLSMAGRRGRWLAQLLDVPELARRTKYASFFSELFERFPSQRTFQTLAEFAVAEINPQSVRNGCEFKLFCLDTPRLSSRRSPRSSVPSTSDIETAISWRRAIRLSQTCGGDNPTDYVDDDWYDEWLEMPASDALYWSYLDYVEWRLVAKAAGYEDAQRTTPIKRSNIDGLRVWGIGPLPSYSRTSQLIRGLGDHVGVLYPEAPTITMITRSVLEQSHSGAELLG